MNNAQQIIPQQHVGRATDFTSEVICDDIQSAHTHFRRTVERLLTLNNWHIYSGFGSAKFTLCNNQGEGILGFPVEGFCISVNLPFIGPDAGEGLEWVMVESLISEGNAHTAQEYVAMTVRPIADPRKAGEEIAHFYTDTSTSTFIARRDGRVVSAGAHGRNELPNNESVDLHDKIRNTVIGLTARVGLSGGQWQKLVEGLVNYTDNP